MAALVRLLMMLISGFLWVCLKLRLGVPLLYTALMATVLSDWSRAHEPLAVGILVAMLVVVAASWVATILGHFGISFGERRMKRKLARQISEVRALGVPDGDLRIGCSGGTPYVKF